MAGPRNAPAQRLDDLATSFFRHLRAEGISDRTAVLYGQAIKQFSAWLLEHERPATLDELTRAAIRAWLADLSEVREPGTVRMRYRGLHRFAGWLVDERELDEHPMAKLSQPRPVAKPVPVLTDDELARLVKAVSGRTFNDRRDEAMLRLLHDCGVRVSELTGLTVDGVDLDAGMAMVRGKGNKLRPVYFASRTTRALDRYLRLRARHRWAHVDALLLSQRGAMSPDGVRERLKSIGAAAGVDDLHPHRFRHTWAHDFLANGGQERDLMRLAGWTSDAMLERYGASQADARARDAAQHMKRGDRI